MINLQRVKEQSAAWGYIAGWNVIAALPAPITRRLFRAGADFTVRNQQGPVQLRKNLARVMGVEDYRDVPNEMVRESMRSYMRYWEEAFRLPRMKTADVAAAFEAGFPADDLTLLKDGLADARGTILVLPHMGNWDAAGVWLVSQVGGFTTVAERLKPERLFDAFVAFRESLGFEVIAAEGADTPPMERLAEVLSDGGVVCLLGDRDLTGKGVPVEFFGETAFMPAGAASLAKHTGARLFVAGLGFPAESPGTGYRNRIREITTEDRSVPQIVQAQAHEFAACIREFPTDWHMLQPLWARDLSPQRLARLGFTIATSELAHDRARWPSEKDEA